MEKGGTCAGALIDDNRFLMIYVKCQINTKFRQLPIYIYISSFFLFLMI